MCVLWVAEIKYVYVCIVANYNIGISAAIGLSAPLLRGWTLSAVRFVGVDGGSRAVMLCEWEGNRRSGFI